MERVVRRAAADRKRLPADLEAFAKSDSLKFRPDRKPERPRLNDPRPVALVPGVANRDGRALADARIEALLALIALGTAENDALDLELAHAVRLGLWRGKSLTGFEALAENVLELPIEEARARAIRGAEKAGFPATQATDEAIAIAWRTETAMLEAGLPGRVRIVQSPAGDAIEFVLPADRAPETLSAIAERMFPLLRDRER